MLVSSLLKRDLLNDHLSHAYSMPTSVSLEGMGFYSKHNFAPPTILLGLILCPWTRGIFFGGIQHSPDDG